MGLPVATTALLVQIIMAPLLEPAVAQNQCLQIMFIATAMAVTGAIPVFITHICCPLEAIMDPMVTTALSIIVGIVMLVPVILTVPVEVPISIILTQNQTQKMGFTLVMALLVVIHRPTMAQIQRLQVMFIAIVVTLAITGVIQVVIITHI